MTGPVTQESWRLLTIVFVDIVGSTHLSVVLDGEDYADLIDRYRSAAVPLIERHGGFLGRDEGDGRFVWFGWPQSREDDAARALRMALDLRHRMNSLAVELRADLDIGFDVRIGIHTGEVIVRRTQEYLRPILLGAAPNVAAKVQAAATPGDVLVSEATAALVGSGFALDQTTALTIDGLDGELRLYRLEGEQVEATGDTRFFGRRAERRRLASAWQQVSAGRGRAVLIEGEAGIGKTALVDSFLGSFAPSAQRLVVRGVAYRQEEPFGALLTVDDQSPLHAVWSDLATLGRLEEREEALSRTERQVAMMAGASPVVLVADDCQWIDASTLQLIDRLIRRNVAGLFIVGTNRIHRHDPQMVAWPERVLLGPLPDGDLQRIVTEDHPEMDDGDAADVVRRAGGNPFFAESLASSWVVGSAAGARRALLPHSEVPIVVQQALRSLLDTSPSASELATTAAVIGNEFDVEVLRAAHLGPTVSSATVDDDLTWLETQQIVTRAPGRGRFRFRHDLVRQLAYDVAVRSDLQRRHSAVVDVLRSGTVHDRRPASASVLGLHFERAGRWLEAIEAQFEAAQQARSTGAFVEAMALAHNVVELIERQLDDGDAGRTTSLAQALELRSVLSGAIGRAGYGSGAEDRQRLHGLLAEQPDPSATDRQAKIDALVQDWGAAMLLADLRRSGPLLWQIRRLSRGDRTGLVMNDVGRGTHMMYRGNFAYAERLLRRACHALGDIGLEPEFRLSWSTADDPVSVAFSRLPVLLWYRGLRAEAEETMTRAEIEGATVAGPGAAMSAAHVKVNAAMLREHMGDGLRTMQLGSEIVAIGEGPGLEFWKEVGRLQQLRGSLLLEPTPEALHMATAAAVAFEDRALLHAPVAHLAVARGHLSNNDPEASLAAAERAADIAQRTGARWMWAETLRLRGRALALAHERAPDEDPARPAQACTSLIEAVLTARRQGARVLELRALADLIDIDRHARCDRQPVLEAAEVALGAFPDPDYAEFSRLSDLLAR